MLLTEDHILAAHGGRGAEHSTSVTSQRSRNTWSLPATADGDAAAGHAQDNVQDGTDGESKETKKGGDQPEFGVGIEEALDVREGADVLATLDVGSRTAASPTSTSDNGGCGDRKSCEESEGEEEDDSVGLLVEHGYFLELVLWATGCT